MYKLLLFLKKVYVLLLFIVLEAVAIHHYANSTSYAQARLLTFSNRLVGSTYRAFASVGEYFSLRRENDMLLDRIAVLENRLAHLSSSSATDTLPDTPGKANPYFFSAAKIIYNTISRQDNFFVIDKGTRDGMEVDMAIVSADGKVAGYILDCSEKFSICMSILNRNFRIGGKLDKSEFFGSIYWDGERPDRVILSEIPKYAHFEKGDTVVSTYSVRFPSDLPIGTVEEATLSADETYYNLRIHLAADMASLTHVAVIRYDDREELSTLIERHVEQTSKNR